MKQKDEISARFQKFVVENEKRLLKYIFALCKDMELSKDVMQDTFIQAQAQFANGEYFEDERGWYWLRVVAKNKLLAYFRARIHHQELINQNHVQICENLGWQRDALDESQDLRQKEFFDRNPEEEKRRERIGRNLPLIYNTGFKLLSLSDAERRLVYLRHRRMHAFREMSDIDSVPISTMMSRYYAIMKKINHQLLALDAQGIFKRNLSLEQIKALIKAKNLERRKEAMAQRRKAKAKERLREKREARKNTEN